MILTIPLQNAKLVKWPAGNLTQGFGENPELYKKMGMLGHNGIDIALPKGTLVLAATDGIIYEVKNDVGGYGSHIRILSNEENGITFETIYGHLGEIFVKEGDRINAGDKIAEESNTGFVISAPLEGLGYTRQFWGNAPSNMGNHLHFGIRRWQFWTTEPIPGYQTATGKKNYTILNYNNGFLGYIDPMPYFNQLTQKTMIVNEKLLVKLYLFGFKRMPDADGAGYLGKDLNEVLDFLLMSDENLLYTELYKAAKAIEKSLK